MARELLSKKPLKTIVLDVSGTAINTNAYTELDAALSSPACAVEIFNSSGRIIKLAQGADGSEVDLPYSILPGGTDGVMPLELKSGARLAAKAIDANATTGYLIINLFG